MVNENGLRIIFFKKIDDPLTIIYKREIKGK